MEETINIINVEEKMSKNGKPYSVVTAAQGGYTVWDKPVALTISEYIGKQLTVEVEEKNGFKTIKGIVARDQTTLPTAVPKPTSRENSIIAQCCVKAACEANKSIEEVVEMYKKALELL